MAALVGPLAMVCGVLAVAGVAKLVAPLPTRQAMALLSVAVPPTTVRLLGAAEVVLAVTTVVVGGVVLPLVVGALHLAFAGVIAALLRRPGAASCGCFGSLDTPVSGLHLGADLVSAALAFAAAGSPGLREVLDGQPGGGIGYLVLVAAGTMAGVAVLTALPRLRPEATPAASFALRGDR